MNDETEQTKDISEFEGWWRNNFDGCPDPQKFVAQDAWDAAETLWKQKAEVFKEIMDATAKDSDRAYELLRWVETDELCCKCGDECAEAIRARNNND